MAITPEKLQWITEIYKQGRPKWLKKSIKEAKVLNTLINGVDVAEYLEKIQKFENKEQFEARKQLVTSTRFIFTNLIRPIDKVFSANGGSSVYPSKNNKKIIEICSNIRHGYSVKKWIKNVHANRYYTDPNGIIFMEWDENRTWPTIKHSSKLYNYQTDGRDVQWVMFDVEIVDEKKYIRFVDNEFDYLFSVDGEKLTEIKSKTYRNIFGKCPGITNSELMHFELDRKDSPFAPVVELADHYLRTGSVKDVYENYHGYPIFWAYAKPCKRCSGEGSIHEGDEIKTCPSCGGSGSTLKKDVTDIVEIKPPIDSSDPVITPNVAGYIQPDLETFSEQRAELADLENKINFTIWGSHRKEQSENNTATSAFLDVQPVNERQYDFSESFEDVDQKITEYVAIFFNGKPDGVSKNWGKRFMMETPDTIWSRYIKARNDGANKTTLDYLLKAFYQTEYANDQEMLVQSMKMVRIEPFVHLTEKELKDLSVEKFDYYSKVYFNEWVSTLEDGYIFVTDFSKLKTEFETFVQTKIQDIQPEPIQQVQDINN